LAPELEKYMKMMKMHIPPHAVKNKMRQDGLEEERMQEVGKENAYPTKNVFFWSCFHIRTNAFFVLLSIFQSSSTPQVFIFYYFTTFSIFLKVKTVSLNNYCFLLTDVMTLSEIFEVMDTSRFVFMCQETLYSTDVFFEEKREES
jgi:hypothetical protein